MKKNNMLSILSLIISIVSLAIIIIWPDSSAILGCIICVVLAIVSIILGFIGRKQIKSSNEKGKGLSLVGIIIGFITVIWAALALFGFLAMKDINYNDSMLCPMDNYVKDCVDNGDGTSTCKYMEQIEIPCSTDKLKDSQFNK